MTMKLEISALPPLDFRRQRAQRRPRRERRPRSHFNHVLASATCFDTLEQDTNRLGVVFLYAPAEQRTFGPLVHAVSLQVSPEFQVNDFAGRRAWNGHCAILRADMLKEFLDKLSSYRRMDSTSATMLFGPVVSGSCLGTPHARPRLVVTPHDGSNWSAWRSAMHSGFAPSLIVADVATLKLGEGPGIVPIDPPRAFAFGASDRSEAETRNTFALVSNTSTQPTDTFLSSQQETYDVR